MRHEIIALIDPPFNAESRFSVHNVVAQTESGKETIFNGVPKGLSDWEYETSIEYRGVEPLPFPISCHESINTILWVGEAFLKKAKEVGAEPTLEWLSQSTIKGKRYFLTCAQANATFKEWLEFVWCKHFNASLDQKHTLRDLMKSVAPFDIRSIATDFNLTPDIGEQTKTLEWFVNWETNNGRPITLEAFRKVVTDTLADGWIRHGHIDSNGRGLP